MPNSLFYGDNLDVLRRKIAAESVDLIYIDPPFNSNRNYFVLFKDRTGKASAAQGDAFTDTWTWGEESQAHYEEILLECPNRDLAVTIEALHRILGTAPMMAYLVAMAIRLVEMHRVLKPTGSFYLHADPTASHYLKLILDVIFGPTNFRSEIIWKRTSAHSGAKRYGPVHDTILFYTRSESFTWNPIYQPYEQDYLNTFFDQVDADGRRWKRTDLTGAGTRNGATGKPWRGIDITARGRHWAQPPAVLDRLDSAGRIHWPKKEGGMPRLRQYPEDLPGIPQQDVWTDIRPMHNKSPERLGYPTQKPLALMTRIIGASSNPGDLVIDAFCGCGTTVTAAQKLGRRWIGIDVTAVAIDIIRSRLINAFPELKGQLTVDGFPEDLESARRLFEDDPYKFQGWACTLIGAFPLLKKGADAGIDGWLNFLDFNGTAHKAVVQVKGGKVQVGQIRDFCHVVAREKATLGFFLCFGDDKNPVTKPMREEAVRQGSWGSSGGHLYPKIQILSVAGLFDRTEHARLPLQDKGSSLGYAAKVQPPLVHQTLMFED